MKNKIKSILITNDDGFNAAGLKVLKEIAKIFTDNIFVIAPKFNQSAKSR
jgi:5'-nucleotidase